MNKSLFQGAEGNFEVLRSLSSTACKKMNPASNHMIELERKIFLFKPSDNCSSCGTLITACEKPYTRIPN
jgi:hypothetical protein